MSTSSAGPQLLSGLRVLDMTTLAMGPLATQTLGDYGVVKVESPSGDPSRSTVPARSPGMGRQVPQGSVIANKNLGAAVTAIKAKQARRRATIMGSQAMDAGGMGGGDGQVELLVQGGTKRVVAGIGRAGAGGEGDDAGNLGLRGAPSGEAGGTALHRFPQQVDVVGLAIGIHDLDAGRARQQQAFRFQPQERLAHRGPAHA